MVTFYAQGGLGNQLFQYAAARQLAVTRGADLTVDLSWYQDPPNGVTQRKFELIELVPDLKETAKKNRPYLRLLRGRFGRVVAQLSKKEIVREAGYSYSRQLMGAGANSYLIGYWQSEKYFSEIAGSIRQELISHANSFCAPNLLNQLQSENSVSLHVRRGDYVTNLSAAVHHGTCGPDYYTAAVLRISNCIPKPRFVVFSDEIDWAKSNLNLPISTIFIDSNPFTPAIRDILLMAYCKHNIIANSSFSWWGAWLGDQSRMVLAPKVWFSSGNATPDLIPKRWERIG